MKEAKKEAAKKIQVLVTLFGYLKLVPTLDCEINTHCFE